MKSQTVTKLWWLDVLERFGRVPAESQTSDGDFISNNPVYARSLARAYLSDLQPIKSDHKEAYEPTTKAA